MQIRQRVPSERTGDGNLGTTVCRMRMYIHNGMGVFKTWDDIEHALITGIGMVSGEEDGTDIAEDSDSFGATWLLILRLS